MYQRTKANTRAIESLAPRVKALAESLCTPVAKNDTEERERRKILEQYAHTLQCRELSLTCEVTRKLEDVRQDLAPLEEQGKTKGFFNNVKNADKLGGLIEDIRDAILEYQVCIRDLSIFPTSDVRTRPRYSKLSMTRVVASLWVSLPCLSSSWANR